MVELKSANHCVYKIRYHMVLCVRYRKKLLYNEDKIEFIKLICSEIEQRYSIVFDTIGTDGDHVHVFVGASPRYSPSKIMQIIKSILLGNCSGSILKLRNRFGEAISGVMVDILALLVITLHQM